MSYFPLLILYTDTTIPIVVNNTKEITSGKSFLVLQTNYKKSNLCGASKRLLR